MDAHRKKIGELMDSDNQTDLWEELCRLSDNAKDEILGKPKSDVEMRDDVTDDDKASIGYDIKIRYLKKNPFSPRMNKADKVKVKHFTKLIKDKVQRKSAEILS